MQTTVPSVFPWSEDLNQGLLGEAPLAVPVQRSHPVRALNQDDSAHLMVK